MLIYLFCFHFHKVIGQIGFVFDDHPVSKHPRLLHLEVVLPVPHFIDVEKLLELYSCKIHSHHWSIAFSDCLKQIAYNQKLGSLNAEVLVVGDLAGIVNIVSLCSSQVSAIVQQPSQLLVDELKQKKYQQ